MTWPSPRTTPSSCEALREGRSTGLGLEPGEAARSIDAHQELTQAADPAHDPVDRKRVEDLVRDDGTRADGYTLFADARQGPGKPIGSQPLAEGLDARRFHLDGVVPDGREQG